MKRIVFAISLAAAEAAFANVASADWARPLDRGGRISDYRNQIGSSAGRRHEIRGDCMSACTMWLGHKGTCVAPDATLYFHGASDGLRAMHYDNPWRSISARGNEALLASYPTRVRAVVRPWLQSPEFRSLTGAQLIALGVPACSPARSST